jgi:hypothetical protein
MQALIGRSDHVQSVGGRLGLQGKEQEGQGRMGFNLQGGIAPISATDKRHDSIRPGVGVPTMSSFCTSTGPTRETTGSNRDVHPYCVIRVIRRKNSVGDGAEQVNPSNPHDDVTVPFPWLSDRSG